MLLPKLERVEGIEPSSGIWNLLHLSASRISVLLSIELHSQKRAGHSSRPTHETYPSHRTSKLVAAHPQEISNLRSLLFVSADPGHRSKVSFACDSFSNQTINPS